MRQVPAITMKRRTLGTVYWVEHTCSNWTSSAGTDVAILGNPIATTGWSFAWGEVPAIAFSRSSASSSSGSDA